MKTYWRVIAFARPVRGYVVPYFFYTLLHTIFNSLMYMLIMPLLQVLFTPEQAELVTAPPTPAFSLTYLNNMLNYGVFRIFGSDYNNMHLLLFVAAAIVVVALLNSFFRYMGQKTVEKLKIRTLEKLRNSVFDNVMGLDAGFFSGEKKGDIISKITSDVQVVQFCISNTLQVVFRDPLLIIGYIVVLVMASVQLTLFSLLYLPVVALIMGAILKRLRRSATIAQESYSEMVSTLDESLTGIKIIKSYNAADYVRGKFHDINRFYSHVLYAMAKRQQLASPLSEFMGLTAAAVLLIFGGSLVFSGKMVGAAFITFIGVFTQITRPIRSFADAFASINQGIAAGERVLALLDAHPGVKNKKHGAELDEFRESIELRNVSFAYGERTIIDNVSFTVRKGETVALVGPSGGGKSTLADLIPRFYDPREGQILIDGRDVRDYTLDSLRTHIGMVAQETILFNDTITNNILLGRRDASFDEVVDAARVANADEFIRESDEGYNTNIGDRGMKLSGGQRQRLSIARAVLKNPAILILDEATSALDTESEKLVQDALEMLLEGRTSVIIAHRLSTIRNADRILVIEAGRIVEQGTHDELMALDGSYRKLVEMQKVGKA